MKDPSASRQVLLPPHGLLLALLHVAWASPGSSNDEEYVSLSHADATILASSRRKVFRTIREQQKKARTEKLLSYPNQGKAVECAAAAKVSSHFLRDGSFTRFADWRFVHRARLNLVPLNGVRNFNNNSRGCRRCNYECETLQHVLCHCMRYSRLFQKRHNDIVDRIKKAASGRWIINAENHSFAGLSLRPDLILTRDGTCLILDVTVAFENRLSALIRARQEKESKYQPLVERLKERFSKVRVEAIVVGALGSWDPRNDRVIHRICSRKYASLMKKLIVSDTIRTSRDIYVEHLTGERQIPWQHRQNTPRPTN
ncbi:uncharacterized protein LOC118180619 [Stegodyphus dumicola]|uniref:uncharacterized protein LOC118180619 n=1 Tax=Stegodyphus dumicola TaxID=202533 RepID=UPI0015B12C32|nr:uncharacterized protein LOC118180619 [Stegodyphus dumicola]